MNRFLLKAVLSAVLLLCLLFLAVSGFAMHFNTTGLVLGLPRYLLRQLHTVCAAVMSAAVLLHLALNLKLLRAEWKQGRRNKK
ncbi:MAG: DUF4405 domain-containing protein [Firmicutes bacterium]|nr:DUF4405 domain-containing protein [Bacillota bacterium]MBQ6606577.1 DUF4405 domain-containing protein [Bacillota bacterium]